MLLAIEGGGFFSSSALGYSKGLTLLLLGQKREEKPMRVSPWDRYYLVDQESDLDSQLASGKNPLVHRCASYICFGRAASGLESPAPLKEGPTQQQDSFSGPSVSDTGQVQIHGLDIVDEDSSTNIVALRSSLKRSATRTTISVVVGNDCGSFCENGRDTSCRAERRRVQWTDVSGGNLFEIREFEPRSDDEFDNAGGRTCSCRMM